MYIGMYVCVCIIIIIFSFPLFIKFCVVCLYGALTVSVAENKTF